MVPNPATPEEQQALLAAVKRVLSVRAPKSSQNEQPAANWSPGRSTLIYLGFFGSLWLVIELASPGARSEPKVVTLIVWGAFYYTGAIYFAQTISERIVETVRCDIIPYVSGDYVKAVIAALKARFVARTVCAIAAFTAAVSLAALWWAVEVDTGRPIRALFDTHPGEFVLWSVSYFAFIGISSACVVLARFYYVFAEHLLIESKSFYVLAAADTPLVRGLAKLGAYVLGFWVLIFLLTLSSMLLAFVPPGPYALTKDSRFLFLLLPIAGFFSLGYGSLIYLKTENRVRITLQRFARRRAAALQQRINGLAAPSSGYYPNPIGPEADALDRLAGWHDRILAGGRYGSLAGAGISIALPLILPVVTLLVRLLDG